MRLFANDKSLFSIVHDPNTSTNELNKDLQKISEWEYRSSHQRCSVKKGFLKISQNSQENTCARVSLKKRHWHRCFPVNFPKFSRTPFLQKTSGRLLLGYQWKMSSKPDQNKQAQEVKFSRKRTKSVFR